MEAIFSVVRIVHVIGAALGLAAMIIPLIAGKGGSLHRQAGWVFTVAMVVAGLTGLVFAAYYLAWPLAARPQWASLPAAELDQKLGELLNLGVFFANLSMLLLSELWSAVRAPLRKRAPEASTNVLDLAMPGLLFASGVIGAAVGLYQGEGLLVGFAGVGLMQGYKTYRFASRPLETRMAWWYRHMEGMMSACLSAVTAFLVFNASRLLGELPPSVAWVPWVAPTLVIVPGFMIWTQYYKVKFGEVETNSVAHAAR